jgi:hypothetical protein
MTIPALMDIDRDARKDTLMVHADQEVMSNESVEVPTGFFENPRRLRASSSSTFALANDSGDMVATGINDDWVVADVGLVKSISQDVVGAFPSQDSGTSRFQRSDGIER